METTKQKNSPFQGNRDPRNQQSNSTDKNTLMNEEMYDIDKMKNTSETNREIAERGYTVRNGYDPNNPNPDQEKITNDEDDLDDLDDDFHKEEDLEHDEIDEDDLEEENDEFDNPNDLLNDDFNEVEDLDDIDQDNEEEELEDDELEEQDEIEEEETEENYPANDPRKF